MKVTMVPYGSVPKVAIRAYVDAGKVREPADKVWLADLASMLLREGTTNLTAEQLANKVADMGGGLEISASTDSMKVGAIILSDFAPQFVAVLADVLMNPRLPESELPRLKGDLARKLSVDKSEPGSLAREQFFKVMFPDQPYGRVFPKSETFSDYNIADVRSFVQRNLSASRTHLYVAGQFDPSIKAAIQAAFSSWKAGQSDSLPVAKPVSAYSLSQINRPGAPQSTVYMGLPVPGPTNPDHLKLDVLDALLGGSFDSRITANIREKHGYTYSPYSYMSEAGHQSYWVQVADVTTAVTGPSIHEIFYEINRLRKEPPSQDELTGIQSYLSGIFVLQNTISPDAVIGQLSWVDRQQLDRSYLTTYVQKVNTVTTTEIQRLAESYISPSKMTVVVVGDKSKIASQVEPYAKAPEN